MENKVQIRKVKITEVDKLKELSIQTFTETFSKFNSQENMDLYINKSLAFETLNQELNTKNSLFYFANIDDEIAGYLKINFYKNEIEEELQNSLEIERIYVLQKFQGKKIGKQLLEFAITLATVFNKDFIWLGVWENNLKAIEFYKKFHFEKIGQQEFKLGNDLQTDFLMKLDFNNNN